MNPFTQLKIQIRSALEKENKLSPHEREQHQWRFLTTVNGITYTVGKDEANTVFYAIGNSNRKRCPSDELLNVISEWKDSKFSMYAIGKKKGAYTYGPSSDINELLEECPEHGSYLVGLTSDSKAVRLYVYRELPNESKWIKFKRV